MLAELGAFLTQGKAALPHSLALCCVGTSTDLSSLLSLLLTLGPGCLQQKVSNPWEPE